VTFLKKKRQPYQDDGHVIASMNVEGMPWYSARTAQSTSSGSLQLNARQARQATLAAVGAALTVVGVISAGIILFVLFCTKVWFR